MTKAGFTPAFLWHPDHKNTLFYCLDNDIYLSMSVTFETKVWENDWELILKTDRLKTAIHRCHYKFDAKILYINNVEHPARVEKSARKLVDQGIIDRFIHVDDYAQVALDHFGLTRADLGKGYVYSIAELVSIYLCDTQYLLHFSGDSMPERHLPQHWLTDGLNILKQRPDVKLFNLTWNQKFNELARETRWQDELCAYGFGFSDQMYLIRSADFKQHIYHETHADSQRYPVYGGELFEKRVDSWLRNHNYLRATYKHGSYRHRNFTKNRLLQKIAVALNRPDFPKSLL